MAKEEVDPVGHAYVIRLSATETYKRYERLADDGKDIGGLADQAMVVTVDPDQARAIFAGDKKLLAQIAKAKLVVLVIPTGPNLPRRTRK